MNQIYKEAIRDAKGTHKAVCLKTSGLDWMQNREMKCAVADKEKEKILNEPDIGIRATVAVVYNDEEKQFYWKTFFNEYNRLTGVK